MQVGGRGGCAEARSAAMQGGAAPSADLGGSSKYSNNEKASLKTEVEKGSMGTVHGHG